MEGGYLTATNWSFGWWRNWGCRLSRPGADGKGRAWEWVGEGGRQPGKGPNTSTMEQSWVCSGAEEQTEIFTDPKGKKEKKNPQPQGTAVPPHSGSCPAAGDSAAALALLGAGAGSVSAVHYRRGQPDHPGVVRDCPPCSSASLSGVPQKDSQPSLQLLGCACALWGCVVAAGRAPEGMASWGCHAGDPCSHRTDPLWPGWLDTPRMPEPTRVPWHSASHPGTPLPGDMRGFPPRASSQILLEAPWRPPGGCCLGRGA